MWEIICKFFNLNYVKRVSTFSNELLVKMKLADVEKIYGKFKDLKKDDVQALHEWAIKQSHLPPITELELTLFLHSCYNSMEMAKRTIDNYYTYRTYYTHIFSNLNPNNPSLRMLLNNLIVVELPKSPEGYKIVFAKLLHTDVNDYIFTELIKIFNMAVNLFLYSDGPDEGFVMIFELSELRLSHLMKTSIMDMKKNLEYLQEALPVRLKGFHCMNVSSVIDVLMGMMKPFIKKEVAEVLHFHETSSEKIFEFIPKEMFPSNYGGKFEPLEVLHAKMIKRFVENTSFFESLEKLVVDDSKRIIKRESVMNVFGTEGSFKKLQLD